MHFWKRMPANFNRRKVVVTTRSYRRYWTQSLDQIHHDLFAVVEQWVARDSVVWDIGANLGVFAFAAAVRAGAGGCVYAFEADIEMAAMMSRSLNEQTLDEAKVCICPFAVGDRDGEAQFVVSGYRTAASALDGFGRFGKRKEDRSRTVLMRSLDSLADSLRAPTLIKIDVEGAENLVLDGAARVIQSCRPVILLEASSGPSGVRTAEILRSWNYKWWTWDASEGSSSDDQSSPAGDIVAAPSEFSPPRREVTLKRE